MLEHLRKNNHEDLDATFPNNVASLQRIATFAKGGRQLSSFWDRWISGQGFWSSVCGKRGYLVTTKSPLVSCDLNVVNVDLNHVFQIVWGILFFVALFTLSIRWFVSDRPNVSCVVYRCFDFLYRFWYASPISWMVPIYMDICDVGLAEKTLRMLRCDTLHLRCSEM